MNPSILTICYLIASVTFILGLKMLSHPQTARIGNLVAAIGMTIAIFGTIFLYKDAEVAFLQNKAFIFIALAVGTFAGMFSAKKVKMTVSINTYEYPASAPVTATYDLTEDGEVENTIRPAINERKQGRNINFTFKSEGIGSGYQMGTTFVLAEIDDGRP